MGSFSVGMQTAYWPASPAHAKAKHQSRHANIIEIKISIYMNLLFMHHILKQ